MPLYRFVVNDGRHLDLADAIEHPQRHRRREGRSPSSCRAGADLPAGARAEYRIAVEDAAGTIIYQASLTFRGETAADIKARGVDGGSTK